MEQEVLNQQAGRDMCIHLSTFSTLTFNMATHGLSSADAGSGSTSVLAQLFTRPRVLSCGADSSEGGCGGSEAVCVPLDRLPIPCRSSQQGGPNYSAD